MRFRPYVIAAIAGAAASLMAMIAYLAGHQAREKRGSSTSPSFGLTTAIAATFDEAPHAPPVSPPTIPPLPAPGAVREAASPSTALRAPRATRFDGLREDEMPGVIDAQFRVEPADPSWSRDTTRALQADIAHIDSRDVKITALECRATICRISAEFPDNDARLEFLKTSFMSGPKSTFADINLPMYASPPTEEGRRAIAGQIYLFRNGF